MKHGKGKGMGYHGGKARVGKKLDKHITHFDDPRDAQTRVDTSKDENGMNDQWQSKSGL